MKFRSKFDLGDKVYFVNRTVSGPFTIGSIQIQSSHNSYKEQYRCVEADIWYGVRDLFTDPISAKIACEDRNLMDKGDEP